MANNITISRADNGNIRAQMTNMSGEDIRTIGTIKGSAILEFATTNDGRETELMLAGINGGASVGMKDASQNVSFWGTNLNVDISDNYHEANVQWNVSNGSLSALNTSRNLTLEATSLAHDNIFMLGWGDAQIIDGGSYNTSQLGAGNVAFATTSASVGALVLGGSGNNTFSINGNYGVFAQSAGVSTYKISSESGDTNTGHMNAILSSAESHVLDSGFYTLAITTNEKSTFAMNGAKAIAILNKNAEIANRSNDALSVIFKEGEDKFNVDTYNVFTLRNALADRGWTNQKNGSSNWYLGATASNHANHRTGTTVAQLLEEILAKGDEGNAAQH